MCNLKRDITTEEKEEIIDVNKSAVLGALAIGIGYSQSEEFFACMKVKYMSSWLYQKNHSSLSKPIEELSMEEMQKAGKEEALSAKEEGSVTQEKTPLITVVNDASWAKRSYKNSKYDSPSGLVRLLDFKFTFLFLIFSPLFYRLQS